MGELAPSILAADFNRLGEQIKEVGNTGTRYLHIDVMDGLFVPSISFGMPLIESIRKESDMFFDVHLMINEPARYLDDFAKAGADGITVHKEACSSLRETLTGINKLGIKPSVSINPETPVQEIEDVLDMVYIVLVMSVHPGFGGQKFIPSSLEKVRWLKEKREEKGLSYKIEIDGGVNKKNIAEIAGNGADIIVAGTAVFNGNITGNINTLKEVL
ncbi:MAG: ribulose-phosphate 3-epimerase [Lachnospiraceae bacterium]|nr:ribulose-phosphate 3-epimerase [Lachnospiraceae bacterium]